MSKKSIPKILILGGGYVTITASRGLRKAIQNKEVEVTVVSRENFHCFHGFVGEMITGRVSAGNIISPVRRIFAPANVHVASVKEIDLKNQKVIVSRSSDESTYCLEYDHLLLALGSADNLEVYPGLKEHGHCLKTYEQCFRLKNHILKMFEQASICTDAEERKSLLTFVVAGGGYAGTEIAGELSDFARILTSKEYKHIRREECRIILACKSSRILPELYSGKGAAGYGNGHPALVEFATKHAEKLGVEVLLDTSVKVATPNSIHLSNGEIILTKTIINAVGTKAQSVIEKLDVEKDRRGRVILNADTTVKGYDNVWGGGDCAALPHSLGDFCPSVGIFALKAGEHFSKNVLRKIRNKKLKPFSYIGIGQGVSIGKRTAVVELKGFRIKGILAWILWRVLLVYYFPTWDRRLRLIADWAIWPIVGRDIVEMGIGNEDDMGLKNNRYPAGEKISDLKSSDNFEHLITKGEVELIYDGIIIDTLVKGEYIREKFYNKMDGVYAVAKTNVRTISVKKKDAKILKEMFGKQPLKEVTC